MWGLPTALIIKVVIGLAIAAMLFAGYKYVDGRLEEHYAGPVRAAWEADKTARIKRTTEITNELYAQLGRKDDEARRLQREVNERLLGVQAKVSSIPAGRTVGFDPATRVVFDDAARAANSARPDARAEARADPVPAAAQAEVRYDEREFASWIVAASASYADAYSLWLACRGREDQYLIAMRKGASP